MASAQDGESLSARCAAWLEANAGESSGGECPCLEDATATTQPAECQSLAPSAADTGGSVWGAVFVTFLGLSAFALVVYVATKFFIRQNLWLAAAYDRWLADVLQTSESKHMYIMVLLPDGANAAAMRCPEEEQTLTKDGGPPPTHGGDDEPPVSVLLDLESEERNPSTCGGCLFGGGATRASEGAGRRNAADLDRFAPGAAYIRRLREERDARVLESHAASDVVERLRSQQVAEQERIWQQIRNERLRANGQGRGA